jgi:hypothetical protein
MRRIRRSSGALLFFLVLSFLPCLGGKEPSSSLLPFPFPPSDLPFRPSSSRLLTTLLLQALRLRHPRQLFLPPLPPTLRCPAPPRPCRDPFELGLLVGGEHVVPCGVCAVHLCDLYVSFPSLLSLFPPHFLPFFLHLPLSPSTPSRRSGQRSDPSFPPAQTSATPPSPSSSEANSSSSPSPSSPHSTSSPSSV